MSDAITAAIESSMVDTGLAETSASGDGIVETGVGDSTLSDTAADEAAGEADDAAAGDEGESAVGEEASPSAEAVVEAAKPKEKEDAEDAELTIRPGENAIPHPRVKKMVAKATEKGETAGRLAAQNLVRERDAEIARLRPVEQEYRRFNELADTSAERLIDALAVANPKVWKPIQARLAGAPGTATTGPATEGHVGKARPQPNVKNADGSLTYDDKGLDDLLAWTAENAAAKALETSRKELNERLDPLEKERKAAEYQAQQGPKIRAAIASAREEWGDLFDADYQKAEAGQPSEILTYMNAHKVTFDRACTAVLLPKLKERMKNARKTVMQELNERPAGASGQPRAAVKAPVIKGKDAIEQAIIDSMQAAGIS